MDGSQQVLRVRATVVRAVVAPLVFLLLLAAVLAGQVESLISDARELDRSDYVLARVYELQGAVVSRESDLRGWLLRKDARDVAAYETDVDAFGASWDALVRASDNDSVALSSLQAIRRNERAWDASAREAMMKGRTSDIDQRAATMEQIGASFDALAGRERGRRAARLASMGRTSTTVLVSCLALSVIVGIGIALYERRSIRRVESAYEDALEARDDFVRAASHDLRSPLAALQLRVQVAARRMGSDPSSDAVLRSVDRLVALLDRLLDSSRIASGQIDFEPCEIDLRAIVSDVGSRLKEMACAANCHVELHADQEVVGYWDPVRVEQIATNLLTNAIKYGGGKPVDVRVDPADSNHARLVVRDRGIGIAQADRARIFERYTRTAAARERRYPGLGLGLWITKRIVEAMKGTIEVESAVGEGSTFTVTLPRGGLDGSNGRQLSLLERRCLREDSL